LLVREANEKFDGYDIFPLDKPARLDLSIYAQMILARFHPQKVRANRHATLQART
jgi:hypothetical protein